MKIEGNVPSQAIDSYRKVDTQKQAKVEEAAGADQVQKASSLIRDEAPDQVSISDEAKLRALAHDAISKLPDVRTEKVQTLSKLIESGEYEPDAGKTAESMLRSISIKV